MIAAAFDERLMGAPVVTGGGGIGAYRFAGPRKSETLDIMQKNHAHAFTAEDWTAMMDFFDKYALGKKLDRTFDRFPTDAELDAIDRR